MLPQCAIPALPWMQIRAISRSALPDISKASNSQSPCSNFSVLNPTVGVTSLMWPCFRLRQKGTHLSLFAEPSKYRGLTSIVQPDNYDLHFSLARKNPLHRNSARQGPTRHHHSKNRNSDVAKIAKIAEPTPSSHIQVQQMPLCELTRSMHAP